MELREIEILLTLAEELHFGRASERMYLSQSRVSQTIRVMETRVGGRLTPLYPPLTPAGRPITRRHPYDLGELGAARGEIVHPTGASLSDYYTHPGVSVIPLRGLPPLGSALVWAAERETAAVRAFAEVPGRLSGASSAWPATGSPS
ncbi:LysR family transcriptional regulator [Nonomuraea sp. NPDC005650]|uniref:helix-turn-helix domain-containing protein n=1 Tax=Nonomuraea sp. NPDC005650 TaxID=3157045 RepID=UPI0033B26E7A